MGRKDDTPLQLQCGVYDGAGCTEFFCTENAILCGLYAYAAYMRENTVAISRDAVLILSHIRASSYLF